MKKPLNIFWILIDSARNFQTDEDNRGLPKSVEEFAKESIFFKNVVTSAPSTLMSVTSMMTSVPSSKIARNYNNFPEIKSTFNSLAYTLRQNGYKTYGAIYYKHGRETIGGIVGGLPKKYIPKGLHHNQNSWSNKNIYDIFFNILTDKHTDPLFIYLHYNVRVDTDINNTFTNTLNLIKEKGYFEDSLIIVNSDHGYPLSQRGWDKKKEEIKKLPHDLLLYNDNILTPLLIKYPGSAKHLINNYASTLDIVPTILNILKIKNESSDLLSGIDLLNYQTSYGDRILKCDNRFIGQKLRGTTLIKGEYKIIVYKFEDYMRTELYNICQDPLEQYDLSAKPEMKKILDEYLHIYYKEEESCMNYHESFLVSRWTQKLRMKYMKPDKTYRIGVNISENTDYNEVMMRALKKIFPRSDIDFSLVSKYYDILIHSIDSEIPWTNKATLRRVGKIHAHKYMYMGNNGEMFTNFPILRLNYTYFKRRIRIVINHPKEFLRIFKRVLTKKTLSDAESHQVHFVMSKIKTK